MKGAYMTYVHVFLLFHTKKKISSSNPPSSFIMDLCSVVRDSTPPINYRSVILTERKGHTGVFRPEVVAIWTERNEFCTKKTEDQYSLVA